MENNKQHTNRKRWSWTSKNRRRHHPYSYWSNKPGSIGLGQIWNQQQRAYNKRQLDIMLTSYDCEPYRELEPVYNQDWYPKDDANFWDRHRHEGIWDLY